MNDIKKHPDYHKLNLSLREILSEAPDSLIDQLIRTKNGSKPLTFISNNASKDPREVALRICKHIANIFSLKIKIIEEDNFSLGDDYPYKKNYNIIVAQDEVALNFWCKNNCSLDHREGNVLLTGLMLGYSQEKIKEYCKKIGILQSVNFNQSINTLDKLKEHLSSLRSEKYFELFKHKRHSNMKD